MAITHTIPLTILYALFLNELTFRLPRDGHVVAKKVDDQVELVPLKNLRFRPDALSLMSTPIIEKYEYMADEFVKEAQSRGWTDWQKVNLNPDKVETGYFNKVDKITINPAFEEEVSKVLIKLWENRDNLIYSNIKFLNSIAINKKLK